MRFLNRFFLSAITVSMMACSFGSNNGADTKTDLEDNQRFAQEYAAVFGRYTGEVNVNPVQHVDIAIYQVDIDTGSRDSRGQPRLRSVAKARYRRVDSVESDRVLDVNFTAETAQIRMTTEAPKAAPGQAPPTQSAPSMEISGTVHGDHIDGVVVRTPGGLLGGITLTRVSNESSAPPEGDVEDRNNRLRELYQPFVGDYNGQTVFQAANGSTETLKFTMRLYVVDTPASDGTLLPILVSYYKRTDDPLGDVALTMDCAYNTNTSPPTMTMVSRPYPGPANNYKITIAARVRGTTMTGSFTEAFKARTGAMTLTKKK